MEQGVHRASAENQELTILTKTGRTMARAYIGIGSNLSDPAKQVQLAVDALKNIDFTKLVTVSSLYASKPMGPQDQPDYMNAVAELETTLEPEELLDQLQKIELDAGRVRKGDRWGARILDLDILLFDMQSINTERLLVPHYGMKEREFVLLPLAEIAPTLILPCGSSVATLAQSINTNELKIHSELA